MVAQEPLLFSASIRDNIRYGRLGATDAEVEAAASAARAHDFIVALPDGYATEVGERGVKLSLGQQQRISIARAFLKDAPILLLDEPTSALDAATEADFLTSLEALMAGRTVVIVAHRLSTIRGADRIYVLDHGRVVECGSHAELLARDGAYRRLHDHQLRRSRARGRARRPGRRPDRAPRPARRASVVATVSSSSQPAISRSSSTSGSATARASTPSSTYAPCTRSTPAARSAFRSTRPTRRSPSRYGSV